MDTINFASNKTKVLLIGVSKYYNDSSIHSIPNVEQNIFQLKKVLLKNKVLNITEKDLTLSFNDKKSDIQRTLCKMVREISSENTTLIVYYAGHGIVSNRNFQTYFAAADTMADYIETDGINITDFRNIIESSKATRKIMIIDACYSGAVHNAVSDVTQANTQEKFSGSYVITSASKHASANYPADKPKQPTFFTGKLISILKKGIINGKKNLSIRDIFEEIEDDFINNDKIANPQQSGFQNAGRMIFAKNNSFIEEQENTQILTPIISINSETKVQKRLFFKRNLKFTN